MIVHEQASPFDDGEVYDLMCNGLDYGVDFYVEQAAAARGCVLEIACGTGRITIPCLQAGVDVEGLDLFPPMLDTLRKKSKALGFSPQLHCADMASFRIPKKYALVMITFNAFIHNLTQDAQIACLKCCRDHLEPGGMLLFDTFFPGLGYLQIESGTRVLEGEMRHPRTGNPMRMFDTRTFDRVNQIQHSVNELEYLDEKGNVFRVDRSEFDSRYVFKAEMELLLRLAGYSRWSIAGDFDLRPLSKDTDAMIVRAWN